MMSLKSIDMQIAVHKNADAGAAQRQMQHKPIEDQAALAGQGVKQAEAEARQSTKLEKTGQSRIRDREKNSGKGQDPNHRKKAAKPAAGNGPEAASEHPYKGRHIDMTM